MPSTRHMNHPHFVPDSISASLPPLPLTSRYLAVVCQPVASDVHQRSLECTAGAAHARAPRSRYGTDLALGIDAAKKGVPGPCLLCALDSPAYDSSLT